MKHEFKISIESPEPLEAVMKTTERMLNGFITTCGKSVMEKFTIEAISLPECPFCNGSGKHPYYPNNKCLGCDGTGRLTKTLEQLNQETHDRLMGHWSRERVAKALRTLLGPDWFLRNAEEFYDEESQYGKGGIWTSNERTHKELDGHIIYDMEVYSNSNHTHPKVNAILQQANWFCEPYDGGTLMMYPQ